ncbi:cornifelin-like isoform X2 [Tubulanus polymorphus]|uniref:cornifelin-like isoform X2 n=1 Tax=Tubulanus polymorphus TaxID=672921 RepID=UPI003DA5F663
MPYTSKRTTTTTVVTSQPTTTVRVVQQGSRDWSSGLLACCDDVKVCCCGLFCLPCTLCRISTAQGEHCCAPVCCPGAPLAMRTKMRLENGIQGTICKDGLQFYCCTPCAVCQMEREMKHVGRM